MSESLQYKLPKPDIQLPLTDGPIKRLDHKLIEKLQKVTSATASANLHRLGIRRTFIEGPLSQRPGAKVVGSAVTLQFMPQREDVASGSEQEYAERSSALWHVFDSVIPGDVLCVQAWGDPYSGCLGEMLITYFKGRGGAGLVIDGFIRDGQKVKEIGVPLWCRGFTPNYASQDGLYPWAYNVPIACSRVLVLPGDVVIGDDDGAVLIPHKVVPKLLELSLDHEEWEEFSRRRLSEGGSIWDYYPLSDKGRQEFEALESRKR